MAKIKINPGIFWTKLEFMVTYGLMNMLINGDLKLELIDRDRDLYRVVEDVRIIFGAAVTVDIPAGYETNGASIPRVLWHRFGHPLTGKYQLAATVHDFLCDEAVRLNDLSFRNIGDAVFRSLLERDGVDKWRAWEMYLAVRLNGWWTFRNRGKS